MATATIGSLLLSSDDPARLAHFYASAFEAKVETTGDDGTGYQVVNLDGFYLMFDKRDDVSGPNGDGARTIPNIEVDDPRATAARLDTLGAGWISPLEERDGNFFGTATDPDGNWFQIIWISDAEEIRMGPPASTCSGFAVRDLDEAERFYRDVLGMRVLRYPMGIAGVRVTRQTTVMVYPKDDHRPATFTVLNIAVDDLGKTVDDLVGKGVEILRYDAFTHDERGIVRGGEGEPDIAWFTDPSGNILSILSV
ncbi:VOC family protein [Gordonia westfalica]|uniref:VOC family protein n=1 Tax=Gordonia westfalica TaxID=158898 RepID=A0ABU2GZ22_9ACTN|nr:VOC family protein [Gordonia westfalica]MDS1116708.1 VOC family protein [Gordonia westfalica]